MKTLQTPGLRPLARGGAAEQILDDLRERILSREFSRGDKLPTEREMAASYQVSGATVREAIRALATIHMVEVRHGSGAYVTADAGQLIAQSLDSMIKLEKIGTQDVLGVLSALNAHAAELAAVRGTEAQITNMQDALTQIEQGSTCEDFEVGLKRFLDGLADASHNALLIATCKFLSGLQIDMTRQLAGGSVKRWRQATGLLAADRRKLVTAIARHDANKARTLTLECHRRAEEAVNELS
ncbi:GntR family transcriptional regulator [Ideonella azotifigens]|uniref:FadR/GntR family transcriptional regulator n=1 Tax=Ideonella azotifigens TaxID=513160 RepID=A0ABN1KLK0_9BURK|nr:GntR family transcriptional regulator [Ideonella azotifigens]MCD2344990.1 GntR family transcriptional regulator [Ideonella azotifigens]